jgi:hypothetical protein
MVRGDPLELIKSRDSSTNLRVICRVALLNIKEKYLVTAERC